MSGYLTPDGATLLLNTLGAKTLYLGLATYVPQNGVNATLANITEVSDTKYSRQSLTLGAAFTTDRNTVPVMSQNTAEVDFGPFNASMLTGAPYAFITDTLTGTTITVPTLVIGAASSGGGFIAGTYYWVLTATNAKGETIASNEVTSTLTANQQQAFSWSVISGATAYNLYRGGVSGQESVLVNSITPLSGTPTTLSATGSGSGGNLTANTYYYVVTAVGPNGETLKSNEVSVTTTGSNSSVALSWTGVTGASSYKVYRGTGAGAENVYYTASGTTYTDTAAANTAGSPPATQTVTYTDPGSTGTTQAPPAVNLAAVGNIYYVWNLTTPVQALAGTPIRIPPQGLTIQ